MIIVRYFVFAVIATVLNLLFQYFSFIVYDGFGSLYIAMSIGTLIGFTSKYFFDKNYIFYYVNKGNENEANKIFLYALTGVFTTAVFWVFEIGFDIMFDFNIAKYIGATIGLSIGYIFKFFLDRKIVFRTHAL